MAAFFVLDVTPTPTRSNLGFSRRDCSGWNNLLCAANDSLTRFGKFRQRALAHRPIPYVLSNFLVYYGESSLPMSKAAEGPSESGEDVIRHRQVSVSTVLFGPKPQVATCGSSAVAVHWRQSC